MSQPGGAKNEMGNLGLRINSLISMYSCVCINL